MKRYIQSFEQFTNESYNMNEYSPELVNEGAVKAFEMGMKNLINNIRRGYGWIDPEYVYDSVVNSSDFEGMEWEDVKDEVYQRLIDNNLLYYTNEADPEVKGKKVSDVNQIQESVNEAEQIKVGTFVRYKKDDDFTGGKIISINSGKAEIHNWDGSTIELPIKDLEYVKSWNEAKDENSVNEGAFYRLPRKTIENELWSVAKSVQNFFNRASAGVDCKPEELDSIIKNLEKIKKQAKRFSSREEVSGTVYESGEVNEAIDEFVPASLTNEYQDLKKGDIVKIKAIEYTKLGDRSMIECIRPDGKKMDIKKEFITVKI
jgi:hypothetical protein